MKGALSFYGRMDFGVGGFGIFDHQERCLPVRPPAASVNGAGVAHLELWVLFCALCACQTHANESHCGGVSSFC